MFYTIYKITNLIDGKIYIGKHQTQDLNDGYMGSGKRLKHAIAKHGIENFKKEILFQFDNEADMNAKEAELVTEEFCLREDTYNLCPGGRGGFGYVNSNGLSVRNITKENSKVLSIASKKRKEELLANVEWRAAYSAKMSKSQKDNPSFGFAGKTHSDEWRKNHSNTMKRKARGSQNSQFGTIWITDGTLNKKIRNTDPLPEGWQKGRRICDQSGGTLKEFPAEFMPL